MKDIAGAAGETFPRGSFSASRYPIEERFFTAITSICKTIVLKYFTVSLFIIYCTCLGRHCVSQTITCSVSPVPK